MFQASLLQDLAFQAWDIEMYLLTWQRQTYKTVILAYTIENPSVHLVTMKNCGCLNV